MRDRHNIVGTEVGRPRAPFYMSPRPKFQKKRSSAPWVWVFAAMSLAGLGSVLAAIL